MNAFGLSSPAERLFNTPVANTPETAAAAISELSAYSAVAGTGARRSREAGYDVLEGGIAVVPVSGILVHKLGSARPWFGMTGYDTIRNAVLVALADSTVRGIVLDIDSQGGEVPGLFDLVDTIFNARGIKPIWAILAEDACCGAYAIASAASRVNIPVTGHAGAIGAVWLHADITKALKGAGYKMTIVRSAPRKFEGNPYEALSPAALARAQASINSVGALFVDTVARNRGIAAEAIRDQQAGRFTGPDAVRAGLADTVAWPDAAFRAFRETFN